MIKVLTIIAIAELIIAIAELIIAIAELIGVTVTTFKSVFEENEELKARVEKQNADILTLKGLSERQRLQIEALDEEQQIPWKDIKDKSEVIKENTELKEQNNKAKDIIKGLYFIIQDRIDYENNIGITDEMWRAKQFIKED